MTNDATVLVYVSVSMLQVESDVEGKMSGREMSIEPGRRPSLFDRRDLPPFSTIMSFHEV